MFRCYVYSRRCCAGFMYLWKIGVTNMSQDRHYNVCIQPKQHLHQRLYNSLLDPGFFFSFIIIFTQPVGLLGRGISSSQSHYLHTGQHKHRINTHRDIHGLSGIRTHDPRFRVSEDSSCLRPRGHCDRQPKQLPVCR
jgi:hypothetical protein